MKPNKQKKAIVYTNNRVILSFITFDTFKKMSMGDCLWNIWDPVKINMNSPERFPEPTSDGRRREMRFDSVTKQEVLNDADIHLEKCSPLTI